MTDYGKPNGHGWMMDFVRDNQDLIRDINVDFPPHLERMIARLNVIMQDLPRQQEIAVNLRQRHSFVGVVGCVPPKAIHLRGCKRDAPRC